MDEVIINTIHWQAPEYIHKERGVDFFWTIGLITLVVCGITLWFHNYLFAVFILISGASLILFTIRHPEVMRFSIETEGITIGKDLHRWKSIKGFTIKKGEPYTKLLVQTSQYFLPIFTIPLPQNLVSEVKSSLLKVTSQIELEESHSMQFMEKIGF